jgi:hypothetical protein
MEFVVLLFLIVGFALAYDKLVPASKPKIYLGKSKTKKN